MFAYISDNVQFSAPSGSQTDYEALIEIVVSVQNQDGSWANPVTYTQNLTGYTSQDLAVVGYNQARPLVTDAILEAYAIANPD